jgi:hypothetical protein
MHKASARELCERWLLPAVEEVRVRGAHGTGGQSDAVAVADRVLNV